jgi:hypothetical protein
MDSNLEYLEESAHVLNAWFLMQAAEVWLGGSDWIRRAIPSPIH